jgi:hypothetical protein
MSVGGVITGSSRPGDDAHPGADVQKLAFDEPNPRTHGRARVAALSRSRAETDPELVEARRDLAADVLADHITRVVAAAPPLTREQRDRLAGLLRPPGTAA